MMTGGRRGRVLRRVGAVVAAGSLIGVLAFGVNVQPQRAEAQLPLTINMVSGNRFDPPTLTAFQGQTIEWLNADNVPHTTTSDTGLWDSGALNNLGRFTRVFNQTGTFSYKCTIHAGMTGTITVGVSTGTAAATSSATPTPTPSATATTPAQPTATATTPSGGAGQGQWVDRPPTVAGATAACPAAGQWLLDYWSGADGTAISAAAGACSSADLFWVSRQGRWMGYSKTAPAASDAWNVVTGEAHFVHAP